MPRKPTTEFSKLLKEPVPEWVHEETRRIVYGNWERDEAGDYWFIPDRKATEERKA